MNISILFTSASQPYWVLGDVHPFIGRVVAETAVIQSCFTVFILPLVAKRTIIQRTSCEGTNFSVDVKLRLPSFYAFGIIHFRRCAEIIGNNAVRLIADKLCCGSERAFVEDPGCYLVFVGRRGSDVFPPLVQRSVTVPEPARGDALERLRDTPSQGVVRKCYIQVDRRGGPPHAASRCIPVPSAYVIPYSRSILVALTARMAVKF